MIDPIRKEKNDLVKDTVKKSNLDPLIKESIISNLSESLEGTNGYEEKEKLQKVSECTEGQARIIARLFLMQDSYHTKVKDSFRDLSEKMDNNFKSINESISKLLSNNPAKQSESIELTSRAQWFKFITANKTQVFWFSIILLVLAFITGNIDRILKFLGNT